jgi:hypothetical protein
MDAINADMQTASPERRRAMMDALGPNDDPRNRPNHERGALKRGPNPKAN